MHLQLKHSGKLPVAQGQFPLSRKVAANLFLETFGGRKGEQVPSTR